MRIQALSFLAKILQVSFSVDGLPYGANPKRDRAHSASHSLAE